MGIVFPLEGMPVVIFEQCLAIFSAEVMRSSSSSESPRANQLRRRHLDRLPSPPPHDSHLPRLPRHCSFQNHYPLSPLCIRPMPEPPCSLPNHDRSSADQCSSPFRCARTSGGLARATGRSRSTIQLCQDQCLDSECEIGVY